MEALLQSAREVTDNESPDKKGPIKISTEANQGKEDSQLHQLRWKMQDTQSQIKELTRKMEELAGGGRGGLGSPYGGGGGGGKDSVLDTEGLSSALTFGGGADQVGAAVQELQQQIATIKKHVKQLIVDKDKQKEDEANFQVGTKV